MPKKLLCAHTLKNTTMANKEAEIENSRASTVVYVWPLVQLAPEGGYARLAVHHVSSTMALNREQLSQVFMRVRLVAAKVYEDEPQPWVLLHALDDASRVEVDIASDESGELRALLEAEKLRGIGRLLRKHKPSDGKLDAFVVFYEKDEEPPELLAQSPQDVANVIKDAVRSMDVAYLVGAQTDTAAPELAAVLQML
jgi:hypothetical protein